MISDLLKRKENIDNSVREITAKIIASYAPQKIILFGSLANGRISETSDIDLIVIKSTELGPWERAAEMDKIVEHKFPVDILIYTPEEIKQRLTMNDGFVKEFNEHGKVVYDGEQFQPYSKGVAG